VRNIDELDFESLIEEIEGLANRERKELESRLDVLLAHLLKRLYILSSYDYRGWENILGTTQASANFTETLPSLRNYLALYLMMRGSTR